MVEQLWQEELKKLMDQQGKGEACTGEQGVDDERGEKEEVEEEDEEEQAVHRAPGLLRSHVRPYNTRNTCNTDNTCNTSVTHYTPA